MKTELFSFECGYNFCPEAAFLLDFIKMYIIINEYTIILSVEKPKK